MVRTVLVGTPGGCGGSGEKSQGQSGHSNLHWKDKLMWTGDLEVIWANGEAGGAVRDRCLTHPFPVAPSYLSCSQRPHRWCGGLGMCLPRGQVAPAGQAAGCRA